MLACPNYSRRLRARSYTTHLWQQQHGAGNKLHQQIAIHMLGMNGVRAHHHQISLHLVSDIACSSKHAAKPSVSGCLTYGLQTLPGCCSAASGANKLVLQINTRHHT